jgi:hypothetical protein
MLSRTQVRWTWLLPMVAALVVGLGAWGAAEALAETPAQFQVAKDRVVREAAKLQRRGKYRQGRTVVMPQTRWTLWGTPQTGATVTMRWRIRVATKPQAGTAGWMVCRGRVTVRGDQVDNPAALRAALATDSCIA